MGELIANIPDIICWKIARCFDTSEKPNWKTLTQMMPKNMYSETAKLKFYMEILKPFGSPTLKLIESLGKKKITVSQFSAWLKDMGGCEDLIRLIGRANCIGELKPSIRKDPSWNEVMVGKDVNLSIEAKGEEPMYFQWFHNRNVLAQETNRHLCIRNSTLNNAGYYACRIWNEFGHCFSGWAHVKVLDISDTFSQPVVTLQPKRQLYSSGDTLSFVVDVRGNPSPRLQWYFNDKLLLGECSRELSICNATWANAGLYYVKATNKQAEVNTNVAEAFLVCEDNESVLNEGNLARGQMQSGEGARLPTRTLSKPTQKVALLIGNQNYVHSEQLGELVHPLNDTHDLAEALDSIGFVVVSLVNLSLSAMKDALKYFNNLLDQGTYALFYFAGHGFEIDGECYLMPVDASDSYYPFENFAASNVLHLMTHKKVKLSVILLDCCRTNPKCYSIDRKPQFMERAPDGIYSIQQNNVIIAFGCCTQARVLESRTMDNGFFAKYLIENIVKNIDVEAVISEVAKQINRAGVVDPVTSKSQVVYRQMTTSGDMRLTDDIDISKAENIHLKLWKEAHSALRSPTVILRNDYVTVSLSFNAEFSNSLLIYSSVEKSFKATCCSTQFFLPNKVGGAKVQVVQSANTQGSANTQFVRISNLELLEGDINIHLEVTYRGDEPVAHVQSAVYSIKEKPLYSKIVEQYKKNQ